MPNRIIKESLCASEKLASLSDFEFRLWVGLITQADDAGRGDARPAIIKGRVFPFRDRTSNKDIEAALQALAAKGCVSLYTVGGKPYFLFPGWAKHQRIRDCKPKFPGIEESDNSPQVAASCGLNPNQSNPNPNTNPNPFLCAEPVPGSAPVITLTLNDKTEYPIFQEQCQEWAGLYPAVDVIQQLRNMKGWLDSNPSKRKTKTGIKRFITGWLAREQDSGRKTAYYGKKDIPKGASGVLGEAELEAIRRVLEEE